MTPLIAVYNRFVVKNRSVYFKQLRHRLDHKPYLKAFADLIRQDLSCECIQYR